MMIAGTNAGVLETDLESVERAVLERLVYRARCSDYEEMLAEDLVREGLCDPVRLFIKDEPHAESKVKSGKFRLISGVSLVDQLVERLLCSRQNNAEIADWQSCPSKPGISLADEGLLAMADWFRDVLRRGDLQESDISGWDWSVQRWEMDADALCRTLLAGSSESDLFGHLQKQNAVLCSRSVFVVPGGSMIAQRDDGVQLSGRYCTSSSNSRMRILATLVARLLSGHALRGPIDVAAMGDDCVEKHFEGVSSALDSLGHTVKMSVIRRDLREVSFCSHKWMDNGLAAPETVGKTVFRYLSHPRSSPEYPAWFSQLQWVMRNSPDRGRILAACYRRVSSTADVAEDLTFF